MRTSIDIPDALLERAKRAAARRKTSLRRIVLDALEQSLREKTRPFRLRDASAGSASVVVDEAMINQAIDEQRDREVHL
jgi:metal-responsive CopG/Arc/MetJ family transcriptional regulator